jgi:hypothetical protein
MNTPGYLLQHGRGRQNLRQPSLEEKRTVVGDMETNETKASFLLFFKTF